MEDVPSYHIPFYIVPFFFFFYLGKRLHIQVFVLNFLGIAFPVTALAPFISRVLKEGWSYSTNCSLALFALLVQQIFIELLPSNWALLPTECFFCSNVFPSLFHFLSVFFLSRFFPPRLLIFLDWILPGDVAFPTGVGRAIFFLTSFVILFLIP